MNYPKITIVTPVFNQAVFIERAIKSVIDQDYPNLEYIVVDGGSRDGTLDIINRYSSRITKIISEPDEGMYDALNKGFKGSTGEIMAWLNADDMYHNKSFFAVAEIFEKFKDVEFLMGQKTTFDENDRCFVTSILRNWSKYDYFLNQNNWGIQQESTFWRRELWIRAGASISTKYKFAGDCELWTRFLINANAKLHMTNAILGGFRVRAHQLSSNGKGYFEDGQEIYNTIRKTQEDILTLRKIQFYRKYLIKIPVLRFLLPWNKNYQEIFGYPDFIKYNFQKKEFFKSRN